MGRFQRREEGKRKIRTMVEEAKVFAANNPMDKVELLSAIRKGKTKEDLNKLRMLVVQAKDKDILALWQRKFLAPTYLFCGDAYVFLH